MKSFDVPIIYRSPLITAIKKKRKEADKLKKDFTPTLLDLGDIQIYLARHFGFCYGVENAIEIARQAGALYDKFEGFVSDLIKIGKKMDEAKIEYGNAMNKLVDGKGNLITSVEKLKKMGAKAKKALPEAVLKRANETDEISLLSENNND